MYIFILCFLSAALTAAEESSAVKQEPVSETGNKPAAAGGLLKTGKDSVVVREVTGRGRNRDGAIKDALYRAIEQVRGVKVNSGTYEFGYSGAGAGIDNRETGQRRIEFDSITVSTQGTVYTTEIAGLVKSYEVLDEKQIDENTYQVKVRASVYDRAALGQTQRVKVALMPVKTMHSDYRFLDQTIPGAVLSSLFSQRFTMGLTQTNKFAVLDRESIRDFIGEKKMLLSFDAPLSEQAKLAETLGADYLLVGTITQAVIERVDKHLSAANYTTTEYKARFNLNYRLVDGSTKQVVLASNMQKYLENEEVRKLADEQSPDEWDTAQVRDAFISFVVNDVIEAVIDRVYPIKIAEIQQGDQQTIILNQGGERMAKGMMLDVFEQGKEIFDADTKESLGTTETRIATIKVQKVTPTMSYARVVSGDSSKISRGLVCHVKKAKKAEQIGVKPDVIRTEKGGVKLPFD